MIFNCLVKNSELPSSDLGTRATIREGNIYFLSLTEINASREILRFSCTKKHLRDASSLL